MQSCEYINHFRSIVLLKLYDFRRNEEWGKQFPGRLSPRFPGHGHQHWRPDSEALRTPSLPECLSSANLWQVFWADRREVVKRKLTFGALNWLLQGPSEHLQSWVWAKCYGQRCVGQTGGAIPGLRLAGSFSLTPSPSQFSVSLLTLCCLGVYCSGHWGWDWGQIWSGFCL